MQQPISNPMIRETVRNEFDKHKKSQIYYNILKICAIGVSWGLSIGFGFGFGITVANKLIINPVDEQVISVQELPIQNTEQESILLGSNSNISHSRVINYTILRQVDTPFLGIICEDLSGEDASVYGLSQPGVYVRGVIQGAPADVYGITDRDIIIGFNNEPVHNIDQLISLINECEIGDKPQIKIIRDKKNPITIDIILSGYSEDISQ